MKNVVVPLAVSLCVACVSPTHGGGVADALRSRMEKARSELDALASAGKSTLGMRWFSQDAYDKLTNRLYSAVADREKFAASLEESDDGRKVVHGGVCGQSVSPGCGREVLVYADGFCWTNRFRPKKAETLDERNARMAKARAASEARERAARNAYLSSLPPGFRAVEERRASGTATNFQATTTTPE